MIKKHVRNVRICITCKELGHKCISCAFTINTEINDLALNIKCIKMLNRFKNKWILCQGDRGIVKMQDMR